MKRILLCGATGNLGRHVLKQLGSTGNLIRALVRTEQQSAELLGFAHEIHRGDLLKPATLVGACTGVDTVISTAGASVHINTRGRQSFRAIDFTGNSNLLDEAKRAGIRKFVYVSVVATPELLRTEYVKAKEDFARRLIDSGLDHQILRPTGFFSAFADLVTMARRRGVPLMGEGAARTNPIDDEEVAAACIEAIDCQVRERSIGGPDILTRKEIIDEVFHAIGRKPKYQRVPAPLVTLAGTMIGLFQPRIGDLTKFYLAVSNHDAIAPTYGTRRLTDYLQMLAKFS